jgi:hypothetical protein
MEIGKYRTETSRRNSRFSVGKWELVAPETESGRANARGMSALFCKVSRHAKITELVGGKPDIETEPNGSNAPCGRKRPG